MTTLQHQDTHRGPRRLRPWLAALLCLATPGLGLFYDGLFAAGLVVSLLSAAGFLAFVFLPELGLLSFSGMAGLIGFQAVLALGCMIASAIVAWRRRVTQTYFWNDIYGLLFVSLTMTAVIEVPWQVIGLPVETFNIPSGSMVPTLLVGDQLVGLRWNNVNRPPRRGDLVAFELPKDHVVFIKRIIALPGDTVELKDDIVIVNGKSWSQVDKATRIRYEVPGMPSAVAGLFEEQSSDGISYAIVIQSRHASAATMSPKIVPPGHFFVLGDNRDNSLDSRFDDVGMVPLDHLRALPLFFYYTKDGSRIGSEVR